MLMTLCHGLKSWQSEMKDTAWERFFGKSRAYGSFFGGYGSKGFQFLFLVAKEDPLTSQLEELIDAFPWNEGNELEDV